MCVCVRVYVSVMHLMYWYSSFVFCVVLISPYMLNKPLVKVFHTSYDCHRFKLLCIVSFLFVLFVLHFVHHQIYFLSVVMCIDFAYFFYFSSEYFLCLSIGCFVAISYVMISLGFCRLWLHWWCVDSHHHHHHWIFIGRLLLTEHKCLTM